MSNINQNARNLQSDIEKLLNFFRRFAVRVRNHAKMVDCYLTTYKNNKGFFGDKKKVAQDIIGMVNRQTGINSYRVDALYIN